MMASSSTTSPVAVSPLPPEKIQYSLIKVCLLLNNHINTNTVIKLKFMLNKQKYIATLSIENNFLIKKLHIINFQYKWHI